MNCEVVAIDMVVDMLEISRLYKFGIQEKAAQALTFKFFALVIAVAEMPAVKQLQAETSDELLLTG